MVENGLSYRSNSTTSVDDVYVVLRAVLIPYEQFKKREKHSWRSVTLLKVTLLGVFINGTKSRKTSHILTSWTSNNLMDFIMFLDCTCSPHYEMLNDTSQTLQMKNKTFY